MLSERQLNKIAKQIYPNSAFSRTERKQLRNIIIEDMLEYLDKYPDTSYEELQEHYIDNKDNAKRHLHFRIIGFVICIAILVILSCVFIYFISNSWEPVTYYM